MKTKNLILCIILAVIAAGAWFFVKQHNTASSLGQEHHHDTYYCPMHPRFTSDKPGDVCPICQMKLVKKENNPKT
ncbi:MAG: heavy metal-binding domain-containing protein, partial [Ginsengibacter sp.]